MRSVLGTTEGGAYSTARARIDATRSRWCGSTVRAVACATMLATGLCSFASAHGLLHEQIDAITRAIEEQGTTPPLLLRRAELHRQHHNWPAALADLERALWLEPHSAEVLLARARLDLESGALPEAIETIDRSVAARPTAEAFALRAKIWARLSRPLLAARDYASAIELSDEPAVDYFLGRASALEQAGDSDAALAAVDAGIGRLGPLIVLQQRAVDHLARTRHFDAALARLDNILATAPRRETGMTQRADILAAAGRDCDAYEAYRDAGTHLDALPLGLRSTPAMAQLRKRIDDGVARALAARRCAIRAPPAP